MAVVTAAVVTAGAGIYASKKGAKASAAANQANMTQQQRALAFQREMTGKKLGEIDAMQEGGYERILASGKSRRGDALTALAQGGWSPGSGMGLSMGRAYARDERNSLADLSSSMAGQRAAAYDNQSFPMVQTSSAGGDAMQAAGMGMIGQGLGSLAANWPTSSSPSGGFDAASQYSRASYSQGTYDSLLGGGYEQSFPGEVGSQWSNY